MQRLFSFPTSAGILRRVWRLSQISGSARKGRTVDASKILIMCKKKSIKVELMENKSAEKVCSEQQRYNSKNASKYKRWYSALSIATLIGSVSTIPIVAADCPKWICIISAIIVVISNGVNSIFKFHENWLFCRNLSELYKAEFNNFNWGIKDYKNLTEQEKDSLFRNKISDLMAKGNMEWSKLEITDAEEDNKKG